MNTMHADFSLEVFCFFRGVFFPGGGGVVVR